MYYRIKSNVGSMYLAVDNNNPQGGLIINSFQNDDSQIWQPIVLMNGATNAGTALVNKKTGLAVCAPNGDAPVTQVPINGIGSTNATWNLVGAGAIQLTKNTDMNLNVKGNGPYPANTPVMAWDWSGGAANETWTWEPVDFSI